MPTTPAKQPDAGAPEPPALFTAAPALKGPDLKARARVEWSQVKAANKENRKALKLHKKKRYAQALELDIQTLQHLPEQPLHDRL